MLDSSYSASLTTENRSSQDWIELNGSSLTLSDIRALCFKNCHARIESAVDNSEFFDRSRKVLRKQLDEGAKIYGVNTMFGGLANQSAEDTSALQRALVSAHMSGAGKPISSDEVKIAMYLRANSLCHGASAIRRNIVNRYLDLANAGVTPMVQELGSIGASGDLIPLSAIAGAVTGQSPQFKLLLDDEYLPCSDVLPRLNLAPIELQEKEGLALINGTSCLTAIAAKNALDFVTLFDLHLKIQVAFCEIMQVDTRPFDAFIHRHRPHPGQMWIARAMREGLNSSAMVRNSEQVEQDFENHSLVQDRYSLRCIPQFLGAILEDFVVSKRSIEIEMNSATDNPLIDSDQDRFLHGGNFLGQHMAMSMDRMRVNVALLAKHNEAQVAQLVEPHYSGQLPASLVVPKYTGHCVGVKPLQILSNSLAPLMEQKAAPLSVHFPVYAEQFNQNLNSWCVNGWGREPEGFSTGSGLSENNKPNWGKCPNKTVWNESEITFTKSDGSNPNEESSQDRITDNVWITRGNDGGQIYNIAIESSANKDSSPKETMWALGTLGNIDEIIRSPGFKPFRSAVGKPKDVVGKDLIMYSIKDEIYMSVKFISWSEGKAGGFSYKRSSK